MSEELLVPIAEHFHSIQGEGHWVGTPMHFIRLAGCSVGAKASAKWVNDGIFAQEAPYVPNPLPILSNGAVGSKCQTYDGRYFDCDTDFSLHAKVDVETLIGETHETHICLTGGEPLNHQSTAWWKRLIDVTEAREISVHIETSGTIAIRDLRHHMWITVAPKFGVRPDMLDTANEIKFLVDESFDFSTLPEFSESGVRVFLCPINGEHDVNLTNVGLCLNLLSRRPSWRLSVQVHKFIGVR